MALGLGAGRASAQPAPAPVAEPAPPPPAAEPAPLPEAEPVVAPQTPPPAEPPIGPAAVPTAPVSLIPEGGVPAAPIAPAFPPAMPWIDYGARMRLATRLQDHADAMDPDAFKLSQQIDVDMYMSGAIHPMFKWQAGVTVSYTGNQGQAAAATVLPLDILARFEPLPEFNIYMGRMIVVADRYIPSGPWGMDEFFFPGTLPGAVNPALPKTSSTGRDLGVNIWGALMGGHAKYYLGAYQMHDPTVNPLLTGRFQVSLLSPEPAFYQRTTYYGSRDLVSIGIGGQYQADGSPTLGPPAMAGGAPTIVGLDDHSYFTADLVVDKVLGDSGTFSLTGGYSMFGGDGRTWDNALHIGAGYLLPGVVGIGKIRPNIRFQMANAQADAADASTIIDVQLSYIIAAWFARVNIGYRKCDVWQPGAMSNVDFNVFYLGIVLADP